MLGGASDSVPTVNVPGLTRFSFDASTSSTGSVVGVVYLSSAADAVAESRLLGSAVALSTPGGAHRSAVDSVPDEQATSARRGSSTASSTATARGREVAAAVIGVSGYARPDSCGGVCSSRQATASRRAVRS